MESRVKAIRNGYDLANDARSRSRRARSRDRFSQSGNDAGPARVAPVAPIETESSGIDLTTVSIGCSSSWCRDEIYSDDGR